MIEPKNKDILRELNIVDNHLRLNSNGKRCMDSEISLVEGRKLKKGVDIQEAYSVTGCSLDNSRSCPNSSPSVCNHEQMDKFDNIKDWQF